MHANFAAALAATLKHEGGWADHPKDPGDGNHMISGFIAVS